MRRLVVLALCLPGLVFGQVLLVSEYGTGDVRGFDPVSAVELDLGAGIACPIPAFPRKQGKGCCGRAPSRPEVQMAQA